MPAQFVSVKQAFNLSVGSDRTLLMVCSAFRGRKDDYGNLTMKKIPKTVLVSGATCVSAPCGRAHTQVRPYSPMTA